MIPVPNVVAIDHEMWVMSDDWCRAVVARPFGIACYEGAVTDGRYVGNHVGVVGTDDEAAVFLAGETPSSLMRIYPLPAS